MWIHSAGQMSSKYMLHNSVLPTVYQWDNYEEIPSVQGEEPPHFTLPTRAGIENHFPGQWMGCQGPTQWPDLTPCSFFLWGWVKDEVH